MPALFRTFCVPPLMELFVFPGSFSSSEDLAPCLPCARCMNGVAQLASCTATQDTHCDCKDGTYLYRNDREGLCAPCSTCGRGKGMTAACRAMSDTRCHVCLPGTFSEEHSHTKACQQCAKCLASEVEIRACQPNSDTLCMGESLQLRLMRKYRHRTKLIGKVECKEGMCACEAWVRHVASTCSHTSCEHSATLACLPGNMSSETTIIFRELYE